MAGNKGLIDSIHSSASERESTVFLKEILIALCFLIASVSVAQARFFAYKDAEGRIHITEIPEKSDRNKLLKTKSSESTAIAAGPHTLSVNQDLNALDRENSNLSGIYSDGNGVIQQNQNDNRINNLMNVLMIWTLNLGIPVFLRFGIFRRQIKNRGAWLIAIINVISVELICSALVKSMTGAKYYPTPNALALCFWIWLSRLVLKFPFKNPG